MSFSEYIDEESGLTMSLPQNNLLAAYRAEQMAMFEAQQRQMERAQRYEMEFQWSFGPLLARNYKRKTLALK